MYKRQNPECPAKLVDKFVHFCERTRMNIEGLSAKTLEKFIDRGWIKSFGDLYELERYHDEIVKTEGFGEKSFACLLYTSRGAGIVLDTAISVVAEYGHNVSRLHHIVQAQG